MQDPLFMLENCSFLGYTQFSFQQGYLKTTDIFLVGVAMRRSHLAQIHTRVVRTHYGASAGAEKSQIYQSSRHSTWELHQAAWVSLDRQPLGHGPWLTLGSIFLTLQHYELNLYCPQLDICHQFCTILERGEHGWCH